MNLPKFDITIIGSGIVGLSIAKSLSNNKYSVLVIEKNNTFGEETSSRNSEVVHSGIFNDIESLKYNFVKKVMIYYIIFVMQIKFGIINVEN